MKSYFAAGHFENRAQAGRLLAEKLSRQWPRAELIYAIPRGGLVVAAPVADRLKCPLQPVFVAKLRHPLQPEFAIGAVDEDGEVQFSREGASLLSTRLLEGVVESAEFQIERQKRSFADALLNLNPAGRQIALVDDGLATGETCRAALVCLRRKNPARLTLAVPCASDAGLLRVKGLSDQVVTLLPPDPEFHSVGEYYDDFSQVDSSEAFRILARFKQAGKLAG